MHAGTAGNRRAWLGMLSVLAIGGGWTLSVGAGVFLVVAGALARWRDAGPTRLLAALSGAILLGSALVERSWTSPLCAIGVLACLLSAPGRDGRISPFIPPWPIPVVTGALAALLVTFANALPLQQLVVARPLPEALATGGALVVTGCAVSAFTQSTMTRRWHFVLIAAGLVPLGRVAFLLVAMNGASEDTGRLVELSAQARALGLRRLQASLVENAMARAAASSEWKVVREIYEENTDDTDPARRRAEVLRLAARANEETGAPGTDVDVLLQRALQKADDTSLPAFLEGWPGRERTLASGQRARAPSLPSTQGTIDCFAGTWCLVSATLPEAAQSEQPANAVLVFRKVAPAASDVAVELEITWHDWKAQALLRADAALVGQDVSLSVPIDMQQPRSGEHTVWLRLWPADGGKSLRLARHPGWSIAIGRMNVR